MQGSLTLLDLFVVNLYCDTDSPFKIYPVYLMTAHDYFSCCFVLNFGTEDDKL